MPKTMQHLCPRCGLRKENWRGEGGRGVRGADRIVYCCDGCAEAGSCTCLEVLTEEVLLEDDVKGPAEEPAEMSHQADAPLPPGQVGHGSGSAAGVSAPRLHRERPKRPPGKPSGQSV